MKLRCVFRAVTIIASASATFLVMHSLGKSLELPLLRESCAPPTCVLACTRIFLVVHRMSDVDMRLLFKIGRVHPDRNVTSANQHLVRAVLFLLRGNLAVLLGVTGVVALVRDADPTCALYRLETRSLKVMRAALVGNGGSLLILERRGSAREAIL